MAEQEETRFKVTDKRKYNPDGSPRETSEAEITPVVAEPEAEASNLETASNVVSFPSETVKKQPEPAPQAEGVLREPTPARPAQTAEPTPAVHAENAYNQARGPQSARLPEASFLSMANMLAVEAAMHLGLIQSPGEEPPPPDLEAARHLIDMLGILQTKTRGNLTGEEDELLENMLADLRMQFVAISKRR
jgi:hypothetical protein